MYIQNCPPTCQTLSRPGLTFTKLRGRQGLSAQHSAIDRVTDAIVSLWIFHGFIICLLFQMLATNLQFELNLFTFVYMFVMKFLSSRIYNHKSRDASLIVCKLILIVLQINEILLMHS